MSARRNTTPPARMLIVDDDFQYKEWLRRHLDVICPPASVSMLDLSEFERWCTSVSWRDFDLLLLGCRFGASPEDPQSQGRSLLRRLRDQPAAPAVIAFAEDGNELTAVRALQLGAVDYLPKRLLTPERLNTAVRIALRRVEGRVARRLASLANMSRDAALRARDAAAAQESTADSPPANARAADGSAALQPKGVMALLTSSNPEVIPGYTLRPRSGESEKPVVSLATSTLRGHNV